MSSAENALLEVRKLAQNFLVRHETEAQQQSMKFIRKLDTTKTEMKRRRLGDPKRHDEMENNRTVSSTIDINEISELRRNLDLSVSEIRFLNERFETMDKQYKIRITTKDDEIQILHSKLKNALLNPSSYHGNSSTFSKLDQDPRMERLIKENEKLKDDIMNLQETSSNALKALQNTFTEQIESLQHQNKTFEKENKSLIQNIKQQNMNEKNVMRSHSSSASSNLYQQKQPLLSINQDEIKYLQSKLDNVLIELDIANKKCFEMEELRDQVKAWDVIFAKESDILPQKSSGETVTALKAFDALMQARAEQIKLQKSYSISESRGISLDQEVQTKTKELNELKSKFQQGKILYDEMVKELSTLKILYENNQNILIRKEELISTFEINEGPKVGQRNNEQFISQISELNDEIKIKNDTILSLTKQINEYQMLFKQKKVDETQNNIENNIKKEIHTCMNCSKLESEVSDLKQHCYELEQQLEQQSKEQQQQTMGNSSRNGSSGGYKVVHMIKNPSVDAALERREKERHRLEELEIENETLRKQLSLNNSTNKPSSSSSNGPDQKLVNERLKELFRKNVEQFKHAVQSLFGYELIFSPGAHAFHLKVRSIYAEREEDFLQFEWKETPSETSDGQVDMSAPLQLLSTP
mmetsp:Transcript_14639/g.19014  ORF Transcript_14639/g.19014 Transcript_14639/m.19014 type:complete len:643 (-) Transcript_14639:27-1955(-)